MSNIGDYFRSRELEKREISKQDMILSVIAKKCYDGTLDACIPYSNL